MWKLTFAFTLCFLSCVNSLAQSLSKSASDAYVLTRMVEKFHFQPKPLNDQFSSNVFTELLTEADGEKIFLTGEDINVLSAFKLQLDDEIRMRKTTFLEAFVAVYNKRLLQADTMIDNISKTKYNFSLPEKITVAEDTSYPQNASAMRVKLYKFMKVEALRIVLAGKDFSKLTATQQAKYVDSIEPIARHKVESIYKRSIKRMLQRPGGLQQAIGEEYCKAIAHCYDPHTEYFPLTEKENFESELGQSSMAFGFSLDEDDDGNVSVDNLKPGSPAFKSGQLNKGDKIESVQWEGKEPIDVKDADLDEINQTLALSNHDKADLKIRKTDGTTRQITLWKEKMDDAEDDNKVKSFLLKGSKTIGYLSLPSFYEDWENDEGVNGCANDVAKEILKLKKEKIDGLIIDVRYNGGGSLQEAIELAGIFIDAGPVGQVKTRETKVITLKDGNRGTVYDGPLMIMVNGYSASASEVIAGTLQDYNRAVIFGSPTYGKATAQIVLPMDTTINLDSDFRKKKTDSYVKVTTSQLFRITGKTAQANGVQPDVVVPDILEAQAERESDNIYAIQAVNIDANKYYKPGVLLPVNALNVAAKTDIQSSSFFNALETYVSNVKASKQKKDISLKLTDVLEQQKKTTGNVAPEHDTKTDSASFTIEPHNFEKQRESASVSVRELDEQWQHFLGRDPYVKLAYKTMVLMTK